MDLFEVKRDRAFPSAHVLLIEPFKSIWEDDKTEDKEEAIKIFSCVELVCSIKRSNPFSGYLEADRIAKVKKEVYGSEDYTLTEYEKLSIISGCEVYKQFLSVNSSFYDLFTASLQAAEKLKTFLISFNLTETTNSGGAKYKPADITKAMKEIPEVIKMILNMKDKVQSELNEGTTRTRNQREIGAYER